jgi:hypothetical protein
LRAPGDLFSRPALDGVDAKREAAVVSIKILIANIDVLKHIL